MKKEEFDKFSYGLFGKCEATLANKEKDYATGEDRLEQFKLGARRSGKSPEAVLWGMREKHELALQMALDRLEQGMALPPLEKLREWVGDSICYSALLLAILEERMLQVPQPVIDNPKIVPYDKGQNAKKRKGKKRTAINRHKV